MNKLAKNQYRVSHRVARERRRVIAAKLGSLANRPRHTILANLRLKISNIERLLVRIRHQRIDNVKLRRAQRLRVELSTKIELSNGKIVQT